MSPRDDGARSGALLINLGTPDSPRTGDVRRYLREFLSDPRVIDVHPIARSLLLNLVILPTRPRQSARAYAKVWTDEGSPLLVHGRALQRGVAQALGDEWVVELGMRYGNPSIASALASLRAARVRELVLLPLFPQYSAAASASAIAEALRHVGDGWDHLPIATVDAFYDDPGFIEAFAQVAETQLAEFAPDHVLMSFHGLPERQIRKSVGEGGACLSSEDCCASMRSDNHGCYRAQCHATARALTARLGLDPERVSVCFQSRLGRDPWIQPFTDHEFDRLPALGVKRVAVLCPSFVADCLETVEEIGIRGREQWREAGGKELLLVPCPNAHPAWASAAAALIRARSLRES